MNKQEFLIRLDRGLEGLPSEEREERLNFYDEMIDDRMEEGLSEEQAVDAMGDVDELVVRIIADVPLTKLVKEKIRPNRRLAAWEILLLVLGSPVWVSLLIAAAAVVFSLFVSLWAVIVSLWSVPIAFGGVAVGGLVSGVSFAVSGRVPAGLAVLAAAVVCVGLTIFAVYGCRAATKGAVLLSKKITGALKVGFARKEKTSCV